MSLRRRKKLLEPTPDPTPLSEPNPEHARFVHGLIAKTDSDELLWRNGPDVNPYGLRRRAKLGDLSIDFGAMTGLFLSTDQASQRIPSTSATSELWEAIRAQEERLGARLMADALAAIDVPSSDPQGAE